MDHRLNQPSRSAFPKNRWPASSAYGEDEIEDEPFGLVTRLFLLFDEIHGCECLLHERNALENYKSR